MRCFSVKSLESDLRGVCINESMLLVPDGEQASGFRVTSIMTVLWEETNKIDHVLPETVEWVDILSEEDFISDEDEEEDEEEEEEVNESDESDGEEIQTDGGVVLSAESDTSLSGHKDDEEVLS